MVDWMVEVLSTFKGSDQTFFLATSIMDRYFKKSEQQFRGSELHLGGILSMFIASKYEDITPIYMKTLVSKIGHNKFSRDTFETKEIQMLQTLSFKVGAPTILEFLDRYFEECKITNTKLRSICLYIAKMIIHNYELSQLPVSQLAAAALFVGLRIVEKVDRSLQTE